MASITFFFKYSHDYGDNPYTHKQDDIRTAVLPSAVGLQSYTAIADLYTEKILHLTSNTR
jgi:hypothetical protein